MNVIAILSELGSSSPILGQINGVLWSIAPDARIVDLTLDIPRGDGQAAQIILENAAPYFPDGTVFLALVRVQSSGEGENSQHRPIAARLGPHFFVGPDNGLITPLLERAETNRWPIEFYHANQPEYWRSLNLTHNLEREVYAPLAAHISRGVTLPNLGERINDPLRASIPSPEVTQDGWRGQVIQIDHFGNLGINLKAAHLEGMGPVQIKISGITIEGLSRTFGDGQAGDLIALIDSSNRLSVCVVNGNAAERLHARPGDSVEVAPKKKS